MADKPEIKLNQIVFDMHCACGKNFRAEDFEPECPYCERKYKIKIAQNEKEKVKFLIS